MTDKIKSAFNCVRAEDNLNAVTLTYLQREIRRRNGTHSRISFKRFASVLGSVVIFILLGVLSYNLYFTPAAYIDVDINPSIELTVNRFERIIGVYAYNSDGGDILSELDFKHKNYEDALILLIDTINEKGYIQDDGLVSVTLQTDSAKRENALLSKIQDGVAVTVSAHHNAAQVDVFSVSRDIKNDAHEYNVTPAKYLAIMTLMEVDPTVTVESCRGHSVSEINQMTQEHTSGHYGNGNGMEFENNCGGHHGGRHD